MPQRWTVVARASCSTGPCRPRRPPTPSRSSSSHPDAAVGWADSLESMIHSRPAHPGLDLDGRLPRPLLPRRPARARRRHARTRARTSTPPTSSPTTARSTCSPPAPEQARHGRSSPPSSRTSSRPHGTSPPAPPAPGSTRPCCWPSTRSATSHRSPPCRCSWPRAAAPASPRCRCCSRCPRPATSGATTPPAPSGTPRSSRSSSAGPRPPGTFRIFPPSSASGTSAPTSISVGDYGSRSLQRSTRRVPVMPPETIRTLPFGTGLVLLRSSPPLVTDLRPWTSRRDAAQVHRDRSAVEHALRRR